MNRIKNTDVFTSIKDQPNLPRYFRRIFKILSNLDIGSIEVKLPDGRIFKAIGRNSGLEARLDIIDQDCFARLVRDGDIGFLEAYMDGQWTTPDLMQRIHGIQTRPRSDKSGSPSSNQATLIHARIRQLKLNDKCHS